MLPNTKKGTLIIPRLLLGLALNPKPQTLNPRVMMTRAWRGPDATPSSQKTLEEAAFEKDPAGANWERPETQKHEKPEGLGSGLRV